MCGGSCSAGLLPTRRPPDIPFSFTSCIQKYQVIKHSRLYVCMCVCLCMYVFMCVCVYVCMYGCIYIYIYICVYVCMHVYIYIYTYISSYYIYIYNMKKCKSVKFAVLLFPVLG